jgi:arylsulfatase A-like enzyme
MATNWVRGIYGARKPTLIWLATHVPLIMNAPHIPQESNASTLKLVEIVDLFPTMVKQLAGHWMSQLK